MRYVVRVVLGIVLGLAAVAATWWLGWRWWTGGILAAVLGLVGFLGTFFVWSADRPEQGYEQVLFDMPNNLVGLGLVLALAGLAFAGGHWMAHGGAGSGAGPDPAVAALAEHHDNLTRLYNAINGDSFGPANLTDAQAQVKAAHDEAAKYPSSAKAALITTAADAIGRGIGEFQGCGANCRLASQLAKADVLDAKDPLDAFAS